MSKITKEQVISSNSQKLLKTFRIVCIIAIIIWMFVIFSFSAQDAVDSTTASDTVMHLLERIICIFTGKNLQMSISPSHYAYIELGIRKCAHMFIFFVLCITVMLFLFTFKMNMFLRMGISLTFCFAYACFDEFHQMFVDGRGPSFIDSLIDTTGAALGLIASLIIYCIIYTIYHIYQRHQIDMYNAQLSESH